MKELRKNLLLTSNGVSTACRKRTTKDKKKMIKNEFQTRLSKVLADKIDMELAQHYGFTDEELDFIPSASLRTGRKIVYRLLGYNDWLKDFLATWERIRRLKLVLV